MTVDLSIHSRIKGPIAEGRADRIIEEYRQDLEKVVARRGVAIVVSLLKRRIKDPTPYYWNQIRAVPVRGHWEVTDGNVVYGPWLEGTGSRNAPATRFRGYRSFQIAGQMLDGQAGLIGERQLRLYIPRLEG